ARAAEYRLRASYDKAIRAPSVVELFNPQLVNTAGLGNDPCAPTFNANGSIAAPAVFTLAQCQRMGVTPAQYGNGGTTNTIPQGAAGEVLPLFARQPHPETERGKTPTPLVSLPPRALAQL